MKVTYCSNEEVKEIKGYLKKVGVGYVRVRVVFEHGDEGFKVRFVRVRPMQTVYELLNESGKGLKNYHSVCFSDPVPSVRNIPDTLETTQNELLVKIVQEGSKVPVWGVDITDEAEKAYYILHYFLEAPHCAIANPQTLNTEKEFYPKP